MIYDQLFIDACALAIPHTCTCIYIKRNKKKNKKKKQALIFYLICTSCTKIRGNKKTKTKKKRSCFICIIVILDSVFSMEFR